MILGRLTEALQVGQEALPLAEALGDPLCLTRAHRTLAEGYALCGALETGRKHLAQARAAAEQLGDAGQQSIALSMCGWLALLRGDGPDARATLDRALELSRQVDGVVYTTYPLFCLARLSLVEGDWATAATVGHTRSGRPSSRSKANVHGTGSGNACASVISPSASNRCATSICRARYSKGNWGLNRPALLSTVQMSRS
jgi:ATP/maltotriose-dependent transcriptional regulator MalT